MIFVYPRIFCIGFNIYLVVLKEIGLDVVKRETTKNMQKWIPREVTYII